MRRLVFKAALIVALGPLGTGRGEEAASTAPGAEIPCESASSDGQGETRRIEIVLEPGRYDEAIAALD